MGQADCSSLHGVIHGSCDMVTALGQTSAENHLELIAWLCCSVLLQGIACLAPTA